MSGQPRGKLNLLPQLIPSFFHAFMETLLLLIAGAAIGGVVAPLIIRQCDAFRPDPAVLAQVLEDYPSIRGSIPGGPEASGVRAISGKRHRKVLQRAIDGASGSLCILSGWISTSVIDPLLLLRLESALHRGVDVFIGFGYESNGKHRFLPSSQEAYASLARLASQSWGTPGSGKLTVATLPTHEKMLIVDGKYVVCGSFNWLSNAKVFNHERSFLFEDQRIAQRERDRIVRALLERVAAR